MKEENEKSHSSFDGKGGATRRKGIAGEFFSKGGEGTPARYGGGKKKEIGGKPSLILNGKGGGRRGGK